MRFLMDSPLSSQLMSVVHQAVENGIGQSVVTNAGIPLLGRQPLNVNHTNRERADFYQATLRRVVLQDITKQKNNNQTAKTTNRYRLCAYRGMG